MWTLPRPDVGEVDAHLTSALTYANGAPVYALTAVERAAILAVYAAYDALLGQPHASLSPPELLGCREQLRDAYDQVQIGGRLATLRAHLLASTNICPYCGFGEVSQLDHYLPRSLYGELAIYPRNLVPSCGPCNNAKRAIVPGTGPGLPHAYFETLPATPFFIADVAFIEGTLDVTFRIDPVGLDPALAARLDFQLTRLKLNDRYRGQINKYLFEQRAAILMFKSMGLSADGLAAFFSRSADMLAASDGQNDWRVALLRALAGRADFCAVPELYLGPLARVAEGEPVAA